MTIADLRVGLRALVLGAPAIATLVDSGVSASPRYRMFPVKLPQGETRASIVYSRISGLGDNHSQGPSGLSRPRMQIDCWSLSMDSAVSLANLIKDRIDGFRGDMLWGDNSPPEAIVIQGIFFEAEREDYDDATKLYRMSRDYLIWQAER